MFYMNIQNEYSVSCQNTIFAYEIIEVFHMNILKENAI